MNAKKTYFLAPTRDNPPTGAIALGNLITSPRTPEFPLNDPDSPTLKRLLTTATITPETNATRSTTTSLSLQPTLFATFLWGLLGDQTPLQLGIASLKKDDTATYHTPHLETRTINPSLTDIHALFAEPSVQAAIRNSRFSANLYLITGVQVAHGAEYVVSRARARGAHLHAVADLTAVAGGVPVGVGAGVDVVRETRGLARGRVEGAFVLAYCLREVVYRRRTVTGQRRARVEGDLYGERGEVGKGVVDWEGEEVEFEVELAGLKGEDPELPEQWDLEVESGLDVDGTECQVVRVDGHEGLDDDTDELDED